MHWAARLTHPLLVALPLLALMLMAPSAAFACGSSSSEITYCPETPRIEVHEPPKAAQPKPSAKQHPVPHQTTPAKTGEEKATEPEAEPRSGKGHHAGPPAQGGNHPGGGKPGSHAAPKQPSAAHQNGGEGPVAKSGGPTTKGVAASASSGGSSPVLPILVAVVVLAAISIGVFVYRERKGGGDRTGYTGARG